MIFSLLLAPPLTFEMFLLPGFKTSVEKKPSLRLTILYTLLFDMPLSLSIMEFMEHLTVGKLFLYPK